LICSLVSVVVCRLSSSITLHGGPVVLRPVRATLCLNSNSIVVVVDYDDDDDDAYEYDNVIKLDDYCVQLQIVRKVIKKPSRRLQGCKG